MQKIFRGTHNELNKLYHYNYFTSLNNRVATLLTSKKKIMQDRINNR
jgi:hypothetical protein